MPWSSSGRLPVLSATVRRVQAIAESEDAGIGDMVAALEADQGLATDLLRYANSAACARPLRARSIRAAVTLVGRKAIAQLALEAATYRFFQRAPGNGGRSIGHLHLHAAAVAGTRAGDRRAHRRDADVAHLGGLLHDVGKLVMPLAFGNEALDAIAAEHPAGTLRAAAERKLLGVDHAAAGALRRARLAGRGAGRARDRLPPRRAGRRPIASPEAACVIIADEIVGLASRPEPDYALLGPALETLGLCDEDFDDLALEAVRGGKAGAAMAAARRRARAPGARRRPHRRAQPPPLDGHGPPRGRRPRARQRPDLRHRPLQVRQRRPRPRHRRPRADRGRAGSSTRDSGRSATRRRQHPAA